MLLLPVGAVPGPGIVEKVAVAIDSSKEYKLVMYVIIGHAGFDTTWRIIERMCLLPALAVPEPGIIPVAASKEHCNLVSCIVGERPFESWWRHLGAPDRC